MLKSFGITSEQIAKRPTQGLLDWQSSLRKNASKKTISHAPGVSQNTLNQQLVHALYYQKVFQALHLIYQGADANIQDDNGNTLLHAIIDCLYGGLLYALEEDEIPKSLVTLPFLIKPRQNKINLIQAAEYLLRHCDAKLRKNIDGCTPLHDFVIGKYKKVSLDKLAYILELLTEKQSHKKINAKNNQKLTAWMLSVLRNTPQSALLAQLSVIKMNDELSEQYGIYDDTHSEKMRHLYGDYFFKRGWSDWMIACFYNNQAALTHMLGRQDAVLTHDSYIMSYSPAMLREILSGETPLHYAVVFEDIDLLVFLLKKLGPDYLIKNNSQRHTVLHKAAHVKSHPILQLLLNFDTLKTIFSPNWELSELLYTTFLSIDSSQGLAARAYRQWMCNRDLQTDEDYHAFIDCSFYPIDLCDSQGDSLIHMLAEDGRANLLSHASNRKNIRFDTKNGHGYTPLHLAFLSDEESSVDVINALALISKNHPLINPNYSARYYPKIRECLSNVIEESLYETPIEEISIEKLLDVYLTSKPFKGKASFCINYVDIKVKASDLTASELSELETKISSCIFYEDNFGYDSGLPVYPDDRPELTSEEELLSDMIKKARDNSDDDAKFKCIIAGKRITVYLSNHRQIDESLPVTINYETLVYLMDLEWDYKKLCDLYDNEDCKLPRPALRTDIFSFPEVPLLCHLIDQIELPIEEESLAYQKFLAVLNGFYIENLSVVHPERGIITLTQYAPKAIQEKLLAKFKTQAIGFENSEPASITNLKNDKIEGLNSRDLLGLRQKTNVTLAPGKQVHWEQLYQFSELFCERMQQIVYVKRSYASNHKLDILTALSKLLECDSTCLAVSFHANKFVIGSNLHSESGQKATTEDLRNNIIDMSKSLFSHLKLLAQGKKQESHVFILLEKIIREQLKLSRNYQRNNQVKNFVDNHLSLLIEHVYQEHEKIQSHIIVNEKEELVRESLIDYFQQNFSATLTTDIIEIIDAIARSCGDVLMLEESILTHDNNRQLPRNMLAALQSDAPITDIFEVLDNPEKVHAEVILLTKMLPKSDESKSGDFNCLMGISKLCCPHCALLFESIRTLVDPQINVHTKGTHNKHCDHWPIPKLFFENTEILSAFLGGKQSALHRIFVALPFPNQKRALSMMADIFSLSKKEGFEKHATVLNRCHNAYSRAPHLMQAIDYSVVHSRPEEMQQVPTVEPGLSAAIIASVARRSGSPLHNEPQHTSDEKLNSVLVLQNHRPL